MKRRNRSKLSQEDKDFLIADMFFRLKQTVSAIADELDISRESIYPAIQRLRDMNKIQYLPPLKETTSQELAKRYRLNKDSIHVVGPERDHGLTGEHVATVAAYLALKILKQVGAARPGHVGLGLGPGWGTMEVARQLGHLMNSDPNTPELRLVTISSACPPTCPHLSSAAFFNLFPSSAVKEQIGLFAEPIVSAKDFKSLQSRSGARAAFAAKPQIDVVITNMGNAADEHDLLRTLMKEAREDVTSLDRKHWVGNVMYRPYSADGPIHEQGEEQRAVTLFELEDFVQMSATRNKHVILIARSCGLCGITKADSLRPLLTQEKLRVWSELVMDVHTAAKLTGTPKA